jgi:Domain of unknown function (DUF4145)
VPVGRSPAQSGRGSPSCCRGCRKKLGITTGTLKSKIASLRSQGHITAAMRDAATEILFAGNNFAHGDLVDEPLGMEETAEIVGLMDSVLHWVDSQIVAASACSGHRVRRKAARRWCLLLRIPAESCHAWVMPVVAYFGIGWTIAAVVVMFGGFGWAVVTRRRGDDQVVVRSWWPYPLACSRGHKWGPGTVIVGWSQCDCRPGRAAGHVTVRCAEPGCRSTWYRPSCLRRSPRTQEGTAFGRG